MDWPSWSVRPPVVVAVLGASNVALGLPWLIGAARQLGRQGSVPVRELVVAGGHGRSYGLRTRVLGRSLPGLLQCGLWQRLESFHDPPATVVLADVGNDLMYGVEPARLVGWVRTCIERLPPAARVTVVAPPIAVLGRLSPARFHVLRTLLFPARRVGWLALRAALDQLGNGLGALAQDPRVRIVEPSSHWYGLDPIHPRRRSRIEAWRRILGVDEADPAAPPVWRERALALTARPESWALFGVPRGAPQPCRRLDEGTRLWLY